MDKLKLKVPCRKLVFFGSVLRDDFKPTSDVDVLVEFEKGFTPGLAYFALPDELKKILGRDVDLLTSKGVRSSHNPIGRKAILDSAQLFYAARRWLSSESKEPDAYASGSFSSTSLPW